MADASIPFKLTTAGIAAATALGGVSLNITHVQFGYGNRTPDGTEVALVAPQEYTVISGFSPVATGQNRIAATMPGSTFNYPISEIGLWSGAPGVGGSVLVFYWSVPVGNITVKSVNVNLNFETDLFFGGIVPANITIVADTSYNSLAILSGHVAASDPHTQYATKVGVQQAAYSSATAGGTADAITASYTPAVTALTNGMSLMVRAGSANATTTPTFAPNGLTPVIIVKGNGLPLSAGDIAGAGHWLELQYDSALTNWVLLNPAMGVVSSCPITYSQFGGNLAPNTTLSASNTGQWFNLNAGVIVTLPAPASNLTFGFYSYSIGGSYKTNGGNIVYPDLSGLASGVSSGPMAAGSFVLLRCDGVNWVCVSMSGGGQLIPPATVANNPINLGQFDSSLAVNGWYITPDKNIPGGHRLRVFGQTANYTAEGGQVLTLPVSIPNKVLSAGATILLPSAGIIYDQGAQIYGITPGSPASTIGIYIGAYSASITWPVSALYWVDGY